MCNLTSKLNYQAKERQIHSEKAGDSQRDRGGEKKKKEFMDLDNSVVTEGGGGGAWRRKKI